MITEKKNNLTNKEQVAFFLKETRVILDCKIIDDKKLNLIVRALAEVEEDIENILINIISEKSRTRKALLAECGSLLGDVTQIVDQDYKPEDTYYKNKALDKVGKFFKQHFPLVVCDYRKFEEEQIKTK